MSPTEHCVHLPQPPAPPPTGGIQRHTPSGVFPTSLASGRVAERVGRGDSGIGILHCVAVGKSLSLSVPSGSHWEVRVTGCTILGAGQRINEIVKGSGIEATLVRSQLPTRKSVKLTRGLRSPRPSVSPLHSSGITALFSFFCTQVTWHSFSPAGAGCPVSNSDAATEASGTHPNFHVPNFPSVKAA